ncbi:MAG: SDR family oxidoreductase [Chloroflexota bacterium]|nr:SDR family oxidoreductase [Chloroflexota bacterium]
MTESLYDLHGKKALVTGATRGLGKAMAEGLLAAGAEVAISGRSEAVFRVAEELGDQAVPIQADLADRGQLHRAFDRALSELQTLDILLVSHGVQDRYPAEIFPSEAWDYVIEVNLSAMFLLNQLAGGVMLQKGWGRIINVASLLSFIGGVTVPAYAAAKGGVAQLTKAFSNEWAGRGVTVNAIAPGYMATDMTAALLEDPSRNRMILARIPAGRWGTPDDMKGLAVFLASEASAYISGAVIPVDGGWMGR